MSARAILREWTFEKSYRVFWNSPRTVGAVPANKMESGRNR